MDKKALLKEFARRKEEEKCRFFIPNGKQEQFVKMVGSGDNSVDIFSGGNGAGKTYSLVNVLANLIWGPQNEWFDYPLFREWKYPKRIRIGTESQNVKETGSIDLAIQHWWPKGRYEGVKGGMPYVSQYKTDTGWVIDKMSYEQDTKEWESATIGYVAFDEPPPKDKFNASISRLRKGGKIGIFMTPLMNAAWIMDDVLNGEDKVGLVYADMEDNCIEHGIRGSLEHKHIQDIINRLPAEEVDARVHGKAMHLSNVILGNSFKREYHVAPDDLIPPAGSQWGLVVDPARGKPWAMGWFWVDLRGQIVFDSEYPGTDWLKTRETSCTLKDYVEIIKKMEETRPATWRILDRHFGNSRNDYGTTLKMDLEDKFGLEFMDSYNCEKEVEVGIQKMKDYLGFNQKVPVDSVNFPKLKIKQRCRNIMRSLERWERKPDPPYDPNPLSPYKDHVDLVRYTCMADLFVQRYIPLRKREKVYALGRAGG